MPDSKNAPAKQTLQRRPEPRRHGGQGESSESEEWVISYMDMVTLLMIVFLVLVGFLWTDKKTRPAIINVVQGIDDTQWKPFSSELMRELTRDRPVDRQVPEKLKAEPEPVREEQPLPSNVEIEPETRASAELWADAVRRAGIEDQVKVSIQQHRVSLEIRDRILFSSGLADISYDGQPMLKRLAAMLRSMPGVISVEGHSDNVPLRGGKFGSNWELSAGRAAAVVRALAENGILPERMRVVAHADTRPIADNHSPEGRAANRRVTLVVEEVRPHK